MQRFDLKTIDSWAGIQTLKHPTIMISVIDLKHDEVASLVPRSQ